MVTFTDDHTEPVNYEYFPVNESIRFIDSVIDTSRSKGKPLLLPDQLNIALKYTDGQLLASSILCHSASRAVGRNRDQRVDPSFSFDSNTMHQWSSSIARFEDPKQFDPPGDTYHFWATFSMGLALRRNYRKNAAASTGYRFLFQHGADVMDVARRYIAKNPLIHKHKEVDRMGLRLGWELGSYK